MANSKNTIQQIPLNGTLNMNTLKTDVKQFEGYNEKNSTVFGGTLSPFYDKKTESVLDPGSYTFFNSKGIAYKLKEDEGNIRLYKNSSLINYISGNVVTETVKLNVPDNTIVASAYPDSTDNSLELLYITDDGKVYNNYSWVAKFDIENIIEAQIWQRDNDMFCAAINATSCQVIKIEQYKTTATPVTKSDVFTLETPVTSDYEPLITIELLKGDYTGSGMFYFVSKSGRVEKGETQKVTVVAFISGAETPWIRSVKEYYRCESFISDVGEAISSINCDVDQDSGNTTVEVQQYAYRKVATLNDYSYIKKSSKTKKDLYCGTLDGFVPCPLGSEYSNLGSVYYQNGNLISIGSLNQPIESCLSYERNMISRYKDSLVSIIAYKKTDNNWYAHVTRSIGLTYLKGELLSNYLKKMVFDNRYVFLKNSSTGLTVYDIEEGKILSDVKELDWILSDPPYSTTRPEVIVSDGEKISYEFSASYETSNKITLKLKFYGASEKEHIFCINISTIGDVYMTVPANSTAEVIKGPIELDKSLTGVTVTLKSITNTNYYREWDLNVDKDATSRTYDSFGEATEIQTFGSVYGGGYNAGYTVSNASFIGYLPNPFVVSYSPPADKLTYPVIPKSAQYYCTVSNAAQSAKYVGSNPTYTDTVLAIDSNNNIILPVSTNAEIINGYSNNDLAKEGTLSYPLIYYNNNHKIYGYYLLSMLDNMTNVFSLQGQSYVIDNDNIYSAIFSNGIINAIEPVCYKKHMRFLGTLPTQAIFWSDFNKSFYAFTGDRVLTKMFEASDINEIYYVGQNPSSLSLWICTNKGIYVLSDADMYKLDYVSKSKPYFIDKYAIITEEKDDITYENDISLYDINNGAEMVPVKLKTCYYGLGAEHKSVMDCWYIRLFDENKSEGDVKVKVNTITDITRHSEEKIFHISATDYDDNNIVYLRYQPKYQECTAMQLELESPIGIYELAIGVNATESTAQVSKFNF